jgi:hypothetical protein
MRRVRVTTAVVKKNNKYCIIWACVFSCRYPSRKAYAPYYTVICGLSGSHYFSTLSPEWHHFRQQKVIEHKTCFDFLYNFCLKYVSFKEELNEMWSIMYIGLHVKYLLFLSDVNEMWHFSTDFLNIPRYQISWKSVQWEPSSSMRTDASKYLSNPSLCFTITRRWSIQIETCQTRSLIGILLAYKNRIQ